MSTFICKVITDEGEFISLVNDTSAQFITPAFITTGNLTKYAKTTLNCTQEEFQCVVKNINQTYNLTRNKIHEAIRYLAKMKTGESLSKNEGCRLYEFWDFLRLTVADHQYNYDQLSKKIVDHWIQELGMREQFPQEEWDYNDIIGEAMWRTFQKYYFKKKYNNIVRAKLEEHSTLKQLNILTGRYISRMAMIAQIVGPKKRTPAEIINHFYYLDPGRKVRLLRKKLKRKKACERPRILLNIYKQLAISNKGRQTNGEYRTLMKENPEEGIELIIELINLLSKFGLHNHARKLQKQHL